MTEELRRTFARDLAAMRREVEAYSRAGDLWANAPGIVNSGGNLALHVAGNLRHFVGVVLGGTDYERDRDAEFEAHDVPNSDVITALDAAADAVDRTLPTLSPEALDAPYPLDVGGAQLSTRQFLVHLATHLAFHLGQLDYHRRLVTGEAETVDSVSIRRLAEGE